VTSSRSEKNFHTQNTRGIDQQGDIVTCVPITKVQHTTHLIARVEFDPDADREVTRKVNAGRSEPIRVCIAHTNRARCHVKSIESKSGRRAVETLAGQQILRRST
jgi:hypothetical protein